MLKCHCHPPKATLHQQSTAVFEGPKHPKQYGIHSHHEEKVASGDFAVKYVEHDDLAQVFSKRQKRNTRRIVEDTPNFKSLLLNI